MLSWWKKPRNKAWQLDPWRQLCFTGVEALSMRLTVLINGDFFQLLKHCAYMTSIHVLSPGDSVDIVYVFISTGSKVLNTQIAELGMNYSHLSSGKHSPSSKHPSSNKTFSI